MTDFFCNHQTKCEQFQLEYYVHTNYTMIKHCEMFQLAWYVRNYSIIIV